MITFKTLPALEALALVGSDWDSTVLVEKGPIKTKRYAFKVSKAGEITYRWGVLVSANVAFIDGQPSVATFKREG